MKVINLDHISAKPLLPEVKTVMIDAIEKDYHNPASQHKSGEEAAAALQQARAAVAGLLNCNTPKEIVFTSGGTESVNHAIKGVAMANEDKGKHIITSNIEHNAVIRSLRRLKASGFAVTSLPVDSGGRVNPQDVADAITKDTILVSIMHSNNETGTIQPIEEIGEITREKKVIFHSDAVDSVGVVPLDVQKLGVDLLSFASNTFYGPVGVGGLFIRRGTRIFPLLEGGVQENNKRAGAENLIGIIGTGKAAALALRNMDMRLTHLKALKAQLLTELPNFIDEYIVNTHPDNSLPNLMSISIKYIEGESVMLMLDDDNIAVSTRSACATGSLRASHVLLSLGLSHADAQGTLVLSFGIDNTEADITTFLKALKNVVTTLRDISPLYQKKVTEN
ncbi:MAG: cysteine desulfurase [Desulfobacterales bacterium]|jgi:cysteine desulfurase|nr:cysteine desulfurase [Desulfobacterales bacterium]MDH3825934.1 cysteine desulfurase [Desulfobacterales bacterium]MDH3876571.1 cysteine desulfurase [Desulfobacterales bacterium]MDH4010682.1 cysteine desulfurase [Desulfobacterales bacterium]